MKISWRWIIPIALLLGILAANVAIQLRELPKTVTIYKTVEPPKKTKPKPPARETAEGGHWHGDVWHSTDEPMSHDTGFLTDGPDSQETVDDYVPDITESADAEIEDEIPWAETAEAERLMNQLLADWENFSYDLREKYPVLFDAKALSEIGKTREGRDRIKLQAESIVNESLDEFQKLFSQLPSEFSHQVLDLLEEHFTESSQGIPQQYIDQALTMMRSSIN